MTVILKGIVENAVTIVRLAQEPNDMFLLREAAQDLALLMNYPKTRKQYPELIGLINCP